MKPIKRELSRNELERVLLNPAWLTLGVGEVNSPKVIYTILNRLEKLNNIKLNCFFSVHLSFV